MRTAEKTSKEALRDLAVAEARLFKAEGKTIWCHHRRLADMDYLSALVNNCGDEVNL